MMLPTLDDLADGVRRLLSNRDPNVWILLVPFPFSPAALIPSTGSFWRQAMETPNTTIRNDPDGRNRLNVSSLTGDVLFQDFADMGPLGNIRRDSFLDIWNRWLDSEAASRILCHCPARAVSVPTSSWPTAISPASIGPRGRRTSGIFGKLDVQLLCVPFKLLPRKGHLPHSRFIVGEKSAFNDRGVPVGSHSFRPLFPDISYRPGPAQYYHFLTQLLPSGRRQARPKQVDAGYLIPRCSAIHARRVPVRIITRR